MKHILTIVSVLLLFGVAACAPVPSQPTEQTVSVTISNIDDVQPLSPGVIVVHTSEASLNFLGETAPESLEPLAEYGSHAAFADFAETVPGVVLVQRIDAPILPGGSANFDLTVSGDNLQFSVVQMAVASNDGYAIVDAQPLVAGTYDAANHDAGTEENTELGSGFEGGQPDPSRGEENIENGVSTSEPVSIHEQLTETIMQVVVG